MMLGDSKCLHDEFDKLKDLYDSLTVSERNDLQESNMVISVFNYQETAWKLKLERFYLIRYLIESHTRQVLLEIHARTQIGNGIKKNPKPYKTLEEFIIKKKFQNCTPFFNNIEYISYILYKLVKIYNALKSYHTYSMTLSNNYENYIIYENKYVESTILNIEAFITNYVLMLKMMENEDFRGIVST